MYAKQFHANALDWQPSGIDGVNFKVLDGDPASGPSVVVYRLDPGSVIPAHRHTESDEVAYVLDGDFIEGDTTHEAGSVFAAPAGVEHGAHRTESGCTVLFVLSRQLDFVASA
ncbi:MAG: cupin domain-containing protein [Gammaproteobacteria bacterium]|jgi:quercetin dioxygenase-like cupin family protein|nr:cupin domain-containing protein [Gammaproteobacteria bacterium]MBU0770063.1 cupin domain-containing protein [Gammaproteobacteria bacterium]MBU0855628.1 cupin domain-containing protein [Gammaproteobacteria bacterium]MBU1848544.1 cupin domain-containing protein [Gammaproteobacteria bacterium]